MTPMTVRRGALRHDELELPPGLPLFELDDEDAAVAVLDPVVYEVVRHRLQRIDEEHANTIARVSGSQVVTASQDFNVVIADEVGNVVCVGTYILWHGVTIDLLIKAVLRRRGSDTGISEGDMFLVNDPFLGAGHYNDIALLCPIFHDGRLISWTGSALHQLDVGGNAFGSFCIEAEEPFDEPRPIPPVKFVEGGEIRPDVEELLLSHSRLPDYMALDLRAQVAGNNIATRRIHEIIEAQGAEVYSAILKKMISDSDVMFRARLAKIPDGRWRGINYVDKSRMGDDKVHKAVLTLEKQGERLILDTTGTDPQAGIINATHGAFRAGIMAHVLLALCHDIPWASSGVLRNIEFRTEPGSLVDATPPALVSCAGATGVVTGQNLAQVCVSKMLLACEELAPDAIAQSMASWTLLMSSGETEVGDPYLAFLMDPMAGAIGARANKDGVDTGGLMYSPQSGIPDVELNEFQYPLLYLYRRQLTDSGGAGRWRGGNGVGFAFKLHNALGAMTHQTLASGVTFPQNAGLGGGYPGASISYVMKRATAIDTRAGQRDHSAAA